MLNTWLEGDMSVHILLRIRLDVFWCFLGILSPENEVAAVSVL